MKTKDRLRIRLLTRCVHTLYLNMPTPEPFNGDDELLVLRQYYISEKDKKKTRQK